MHQVFGLSQLVIQLSQRHDRAVIGLKQVQFTVFCGASPVGASIGVEWPVSGILHGASESHWNAIDFVSPLQWSFTQRHSTTGRVSPRSLCELFLLSGQLSRLLTCLRDSRPLGKSIFRVSAFKLKSTAKRCDG